MKQQTVTTVAPYIKCDECNGCSGEWPHLCPYQTNVRNNFNPEFCNCCDACKTACASAIGGLNHVST